MSNCVNNRCRRLLNPLTHFSEYLIWSSITLDRQVNLPVDLPVKGHTGHEWITMSATMFFCLTTSQKAKFRYLAVFFRFLKNHRSFFFPSNVFPSTKSEFFLVFQTLRMYSSASQWIPPRGKMTYSIYNGTRDLTQ